MEKKLKLCLQCGAKEVSRDDVFAVETPSPNGRYCPLPYESFVTRLEKQMILEGIVPTSEAWALSKDGARMFGLMQLSIDGLTTADFAPVMGVRSSHDKSFAAGVVIGNGVFVCDNLAFSGEIAITRRHTANLYADLAGLIVNMVDKMPSLFNQQSKLIEAYKNRRFSDQEFSHFLIGCFEHGALNITDVKRVLTSYRNPEEQVLADLRDNGGHDTAWAAYNAVTSVLRGNVWELPARTAALHKVTNHLIGVDSIDVETIS